MESLNDFAEVEEFVKNLASVSLNSDEFIGEVEKRLSKASSDLKCTIFFLIGLTLRQMSSFVLAVGTWNHILEHYLKSSDRTNTMLCHGNLGESYENLGHSLKAIEHHRKALQIAIDLNNKDAEAAGYISIALSYSNMGNFREALRCLEKHWQIIRKMGRKDLELAYYTNLGLTYVGLGNLGSAVECLEKALQIAIETKTKEDQCYNNLGYIYRRLGQPIGAIKYIKKAMQIATKNKDSYGQSTCYINLGYTYIILGNLRKAFEYHQKALRIALDFEDRRLQCKCYESLAITLSSGKNFKKAIDYLNNALQIAVDIGNQSTELSCYVNMGNLFRDMGNPEKVIEYSERALDTAKKIGDLEGERIANLSLGTIYYAYETKENCAYGYLKRSIELSDVIDERLSEDEHRIGFRGEASSAYQYMVPLCWQLGKATEAFEYAERGKSRALLKLLSASNIKPSIKLTSQLKSLLYEEEQCLAELREVQTRHLRKTKWTAEPGEVESISERLNLIHNEIQKFDPEYVSLRKATPFSPDDVRSMLCSEKKHTVVLEYFITEDKVFIFVVSKDGLHVEPVSISRKKLLTYIRAYQRELANHADYGEIGDTWLELSNYLIDPISDYLIKSDLIYFIPYAGLHYLPMHALELNGEPVIKNHPVCYSPAASVIKFCKNKGTNRLEDCASFGVVFEDEAKKVARLFKTEPYLGKTATKENVLSCTGRDIIHLSCHGKFDSFDPLSSGLLLHNEKILTAREIFNWRIHSELVTLSACQTGVNETKPGDELIGLTRAFLYAGVPSVVVSLWSVHAPSTQELMLEFYKLLKHGKDKATALQEAQKEIMEKDEYSHPYFWAPFILVGDWE